MEEGQQVKSGDESDIPAGLCVVLIVISIVISVATLSLLLVSTYNSSGASIYRAPGPGNNLV